MGMAVRGMPQGYILLGMAAGLYLMDSAIGVQRRGTAKAILPECDFSKTFGMEVFGQIWVVMATLAALICSGLSRKMLWRGRVYTLVSPSKTLVEQQE